MFIKGYVEITEGAWNALCDEPKFPAMPEKGSVGYNSFTISDEIVARLGLLYAPGTPAIPGLLYTPGEGWRDRV